MRWTQDKDVPKLKYTVARDAKRRGWHYLWEGHGFGVQVFASGSRKWIQCGSTWDPLKRKRTSYFRSLGSLEQVKLADARIAAGRIKADAKEGIESDPKSVEKSSNDRIAAEAAPEKSPGLALAETTLDCAIKYYVENRNCAPSSKSTLNSLLRKHLADWLQTPLLSIDTPMLQTRYKLVMQRVKERGDALDARYARLNPTDRLMCAPPGYHTGIKTAHDIMEGFGRVYRYWTTKHQAVLQRAGALIPICPTAALVDDLIPQPQRVKSVPGPALRKLFASFSSYRGNRLHPLLARLLLATGARVGVLMGCRREYIKHDRIVIPAHVEKSKVRWKKRHLEHLAYVIPMTPDIAEILQEIDRVASQYGDAQTWLFPSRTSASGHMEEESNVVLCLREHSGVRFNAHQLRHNVASAAEDLGYRKEEITELLGQSRGTVTDRYIDEQVSRHRKMLISVNAAMREAITGKVPPSLGRPPSRRRSATRARSSSVNFVSPLET